MENKFGIMQSNDNSKDEYIYTVGKDGEIPIVLLVLQASKYKYAVERYISQYAASSRADEIATDIYLNNPHLEANIKHIVEVFEQRDAETQAKIAAEWEKNGMPVFEGFSKPPKDMVKYLNEYPRDAIMDFSVYASKLAIYMAMLTPAYGTGRGGMPQVCSMSYIAFHQREEFMNAQKSVRTAFNYVLSEIIRVMKLRNIEINDNNMTLIMPEYKAVTFRTQMYPGF